MYSVYGEGDRSDPRSVGLHRLSQWVKEVLDWFELFDIVGV